MDDRRRTISSEEQMIGEALMRVSNTLEAQRLTKSLDYQEKLRARSNIRLIIAIIALFVAMMMMVISGLLLFVLWRYADPVLDTVVPFLKRMFGDFDIIWSGLVESLTYVPVMVEQLTRLLENVIVMLEGINQIDLAGMMRYLTSMLGTLSGMLSDVRGALGSMMPMLSVLGDALTNMLTGDFSFIGDMLSGMGIDTQALMANMGSLINGLVNAMGGFGSVMGDLGDMMQSEEMANLGNGVTSIVSDLGDMLQSDEMTNLGNSITSAIGAAGDAINADQATAIVGGLGNAMEKMVGALDSMAGGLQGLAELLGRLGSIGGGN